MISFTVLNAGAVEDTCCGTSEEGEVDVDIVDAGCMVFKASDGFIHSLTRWISWPSIGSGMLQTVLGLATVVFGNVIRYMSY